MAKIAKKKLANIRAILLDIDGVLTDGTILWMEGTGWTASYSVIDGFGIKRAMKAGIEVGVISGGSFTSHRKRAESLGIKHIHLGNEDKTAAYASIKSELGLTDAEIAYVGDELFDIPLLVQVGFAATVPHAPKEVKKEVDYTTKAPGGRGAVREVIDLILDAKAAMK